MFFGTMLTKTAVLKSFYVLVANNFASHILCRTFASLVSNLEIIRQIKFGVDPYRVSHSWVADEKTLPKTPLLFPESVSKWSLTKVF
jgi:hypothetical protein